MYSYNSSILGSRGRRTVVQGQPRLEALSEKQTKSKGLEASGGAF
jgi:hypothetical protein